MVGAAGRCLGHVGEGVIGCCSGMSDHALARPVLTHVRVESNHWDREVVIEHGGHMAADA